MHIVKTPKEHVSASEKNKDKIQSLLKTLEPLPIVFFAYMRTYPSGVVAAIYSETKGIQQVLDKGIYTPFFDEKGCMLPEGFYFSNDVPQLLASKKDQNAIAYYVEEIREVAKNVTASWDDGFFIVKENPLYQETFYFFSSIPSELHRVFFLNNCRVLEEFSVYFLSEGKRIIKDSLRCIYKYPFVAASKDKNKAEELLSGNCEQLIRSRFRLKNYRFIHSDGEVELTEKEFTCLKFIASGIPPSEAAPSLNISIKGYESLIQRVKDKFNVSDKKRLHSIYSKSIYSK